MTPFLSWKFIAVLVAVVLANAVASGLAYYFGMASTSLANDGPLYGRISLLSAALVSPVYYGAVVPLRAIGVDWKIGAAVGILIEAIIVHVGAGWLSCKRKGKPLELRNLFRFSARELQFSARQLLIFVTIVCVICGVYGGRKAWKARTAMHRQTLMKMGIYYPDHSGHDFQGYYQHWNSEGERVRFNMWTYERWLSSRGKSSTPPLPPELLRIKNVTQLSFECATCLPPEIAHFSDLRVLTLQGNDWCGDLRSKLTTLPPEIGNLSDLRVLDLQGNALTTLPPEIGRLTKLEALDLRGNPITESSLKHLASLEHLELLFLNDTKMERSAVKTFKQAHPKCTVHR